MNWKVGSESYTGDMFIEDGSGVSVALVNKKYAHLVAAAPAMLNALKSFGAYLEAGFPANLPLKKIAADLAEQALAHAAGKGKGNDTR